MYSSIRNFIPTDNSNNKKNKIFWDKLKRNTNIRVKTICKTKCNTVKSIKSIKTIKTIKSITKSTIDDCVITNTHISLRDCSSDDRTKYHYITPIELSVDTLQYAFDNNMVKLVIDKSNKVYLDIENFPTLLVETVEDGDFKDTRRDEGFYFAYEDITTLEKIPYEIQLKDYLEKGVYKSFVKYTDNIRELNYKNGISIQDINYVKEIATSLNRANPSVYTCDLQGIPNKYIITETVMLDDGEYVICGYPDPSKMRTYLTMLNNPAIQAKITEIHKKHRTEFAQSYADMYNVVMKTKDIDNDNISSINDINTDMHKFLPPAMNIKYIKTWYKENPNLSQWVKSADYQEKLRYMDENGLHEHMEMVLREIEKSLIPESEYSAEMEKLDKALPEYNKYVNELLLEYLNKPMMRIRYYFIIFKKHLEYGLVPAIFNMKQLEAKHTPLLEKVLDLIQERIPAIYGILEDSRNNLNRYKLFHSYAKYGDFFYISTEYLHTMSNISHYAYIYKNSISLEELIYSSSKISNLGNSFWKDIKLEYDLKKYRIETELLHNGGSKNPYGILPINTNNSYNRENNRNSRNSGNATKKSNSYRIIGSISGNILLMYEKTYQEYVIIYKHLDKIFVLEIKSNIASIKNQIKNNILNGNNVSNALYTCKNSMYRNMYYTGKLFKLTTDIYEINNDILKVILKNNPTFYAVSHKPNINDKYIKFYEYFNVDLLDYKFSANNGRGLNNYEVYNLYNILPIITINFLFSAYYLNALQNYNVSRQSGKTTKIINRNNREITSIKYGESNIFNVIVNPNNCGYNFIEIYNKQTDKIVVWILPFNNSKYLREYTELEEMHIPMLQEIINIYDDENKLIFIHNLPTIKNYCFHIHIVNKMLYKRHEGEKGSIFTREKYIKQILQNLIINKNYYNDYNVANVIIK